MKWLTHRDLRHLITRRIRLTEGLGDRLIGDFAVAKINGTGDWSQIAGSRFDPTLRDLDDPRKRHVAKCKRARAPDRARHVRYAVVENFFLHVRRIAMRRRPAGRDTAALIDRDIDDHATRLHPPQVFAVHKHWS